MAKINIDESFFYDQYIGEDYYQKLEEYEAYMSSLIADGIIKSYDYYNYSNSGYHSLGIDVYDNSSDNKTYSKTIVGAKENDVITVNTPNLSLKSADEVYYDGWNNYFIGVNSGDGNDKVTLKSSTIYGKVKKKKLLVCWNFLTAFAILGKGNDNLTVEGNDLYFYYNNGDGNDVITRSPSNSNLM